MTAVHISIDRVDVKRIIACFTGAEIGDTLEALLKTKTEGRHE